MKYSVVIPLYNKEKHIARAIYSVLSQEVNDFELIVVDDGSTDQGIDVVNNIKDSRIKLIRQSNRGVSAARNKGIANAKGELVALLDADDEWMPNHLFSFDKMIEMYPEAGLYTTAYTVIDVDGSIVDPWNGGLSSRIEIEKINIYKESYNNLVLPVHTSAVCIPKSVLDRIGGFIEGQHLGEDLDMWGRVALIYDVVFNSIASSMYYKDSINRSIEKMPPDEMPFVTSYKNDSNKLTNIYIKEYVVMQQFIVASKFIMTGNMKQARKVLSLVDTKLQRKKLVKYYISTYIPVFMLRLWMSFKH